MGFGSECVREEILYKTHTLSKKNQTIFFPLVSNGERVGKLSIVVGNANHEK
jgi:hypothetical protein